MTRFTRRRSLLRGDSPHPGMDSLPGSLPLRFISDSNACKVQFPQLTLQRHTSSILPNNPSKGASLTRGSRSVPKISPTKSRKTLTFGANAAGPK